jgi:hypothetical protein
VGAFVKDGYVPHVQNQLNTRFEPGDALTEMIAFQGEFKLFSRQHTLRSSFGLLNIAPVGEADRDGFMRYLDWLQRTDAKVDDKATSRNGHDQIITSLQQNLEGKSPLPVYFTWHPAEQPKGAVLVTSSAPAYNFSSANYLIISVPTMPAGGAKARARKKRA